MVIIQGNSLLPISPLPGRTGNYYCDWDYLKQWWPEEDLPMATKICYEESQGEWWRVNDSLYGVKELSCGIWQINVLVHTGYTCEEMKDPIKSTLVAIKIQKEGGWEAWRNSLQKIKNRYNLP